MTKVLVTADIHSNAPALEAVLKDANFDRVVSVGDMTGVLGFPVETMEMLQSVDADCVYGNHCAYFRSDYNWYPEHAVQKQEFRVVNATASDEYFDWLDSLPEELNCSFDGVSLYMVHGNPFADRLLDKRWGEYKCGYPASGYCGKGEFTRVAAFVDADFACVGHTHHQSKLDCSKFGHDTTVFNPGSVGVAFDEPADYAVLDTESGEVDLCSVEYDTSRLEDKFEELNITPEGDS